MPIALISTLDTKGREVAFLKSCLKELGRSVVVIDVGLAEPDGVLPEISRFDVAEAAGADMSRLAGRPRDEVMATMGRGAGEVLHRLWAQAELSGVLGLGGNQGTAVVCAAMRELPLGVPKFVVSTIASGNMRPYIGASDIAVLFSVADLLGGPNPVVEPVLRNAAAAIAGMTALPPVSGSSKRPLVAITALGNTHPAVARAVEILRGAGFEIAVFHASGACGSAMERLIRAGRVAAVLELTPHELTEEVLKTGVYQPVEGGRLLAAGDQIAGAMNLESLLITRGKDGMVVFPRRHKPVDIPIYGSDEVADVTGAGDTVIATFTAALAAGASAEEAAQLANYAGGIVVMKRGTATVSQQELLEALEKTPPVAREH